LASRPYQAIVGVAMMVRLSIWARAARAQGGAGLTSGGGDLTSLPMGLRERGRWGWAHAEARPGSLHA